MPRRTTACVHNRQGLVRIRSTDEAVPVLLGPEGPTAAVLFWCARCGALKLPGGVWWHAYEDVQRPAER